jgi:hypothetical protein
LGIALKRELADERDAWSLPDPNAGFDLNATSTVWRSFSAMISATSNGMFETVTVIASHDPCRTEWISSGSKSRCAKKFNTRGKVCGSA